MIKIDGFLIDCTLTETHKLDSEVTEYPVESGSQITDNVRPLPIAVTLDSIVSDNPMPGPVATARGDDGSGAPLDHAPSDAAVAKLVAIRTAREPIAIETSLKRYENMVMTSLEIPRDAETGQALRFTVEFQEVIFVTNNRATIKVAPPKQTGLGAKKDLGNKPTFDLKKGAVVWHHTKPAPIWSTREVVGYSSSDARTKGTSGFYHQNGQPFTQEDLDDFNSDSRLWYATHDANGNEVTDAQDLDAALTQNSRNQERSNVVHQTADGTWADENGHPVTKDPGNARRWLGY